MRAAGLDPDDPERCVFVWVPGAFELALAAMKLGVAYNLDAVVALGCVVRGETDHYTHVASATAHGIQQASLMTGIPIAFGVLTTENFDQAIARSGDVDETNKGFEATITALDIAVTLRKLRRD